MDSHSWAKMDSHTWAQMQRQIAQATQASKVATWPSQTVLWGSTQTLNASHQYSASNTKVLPQQSSQGWSNRQNTGVPSQQSSQGWSSRQNTGVPSQQSSQGWSNRQDTGAPSQQSSQGWSSRQNTGAPSQQSSQRRSSRQNTGAPAQQSTQGWSSNLNMRISPQQSCQTLSAMLSTNANTGVFSQQNSPRLRTNVNTRVSPQQSCQTLSAMLSTNANSVVFPQENSPRLQTNVNTRVSPQQSCQALSAMLSTNVEAGVSPHQNSQRLGTSVNTRVPPHQNSQTMMTNVDTGVLSNQQIQIWNKNWPAVSFQQTAQGKADQCFDSQSGNVQLMVSSGSQVSVQQVIPQISAQTSQAQINMSAAVGLSSASQNGFYQVLNGGSANTSTVTSFPNQQVASLNMSSPTAAPNPNHGQNSVHNGFPLLCAPPSYKSAISHLSRNTIARAQSSVQQVVGELSIKQQIQIQLNNRRQIDRTNDRHLNSSESMAIARIEEELRNSVPVTLSNSPSIKSNHDVQHTQSNSSLHQSVVFSSKELPHASVSREQPSIEALPHGSSVPNVLLTQATGNGVKNGGQAADTFYPTNTMVTLSHTSSSAQHIAQQRSKQSATEMSLLTANNSTVHTSPSRTRAVAIVPPLSQESHLNATKGAPLDTTSQSSKCTTAESSSYNHPTELRKASNADPGNPTGVTSEKSKISDSPAANKSTAPPSDSIRHQDSPQKGLVAEETVSELISNTQMDVPAPKRAAAETAEDETERPNDEEGYVKLAEIETINCVLSSLGKITNLGSKMSIVEGIKPRMLNSEAQIVDLFWNGDADKCNRIMESSWLEKNTTRAQQFCEKYVTENTVIASRVRRKHVKHLMKHHVLGHNEVYTEPPYKSFWLNLNEQLDDIDKEFGLPWCLRRHACTLESDVQMDEAEILNISETNDLAKKDSEPEVVKLGEQKASCTAGEASNQNVGPTITESEDQNDPYKSIEIEVLPLEKAIAIFEQARKGADIQPKIVVDRSAEAEQHEAVSGLMQDNKLVSEPLEMCCFEKLKQIINGLPSSECSCQEEGNHNDIIKQTLEETMLEKVAKKDVFVESDVTSGDDNAAKSAASINIPVLSLFDNTDLLNDEEPNDISDKVISSLPSIVLRGGNEDGDPYGAKNEISEQTEDLDNAQDEASDSGATDQSRAGTETPLASPVDDEQDLSSFKLALSEDSELSSCESEAQTLESSGQAQLSSTESSEGKSEPGLGISLSLGQVKKWKHRHSLKIDKNQQKDFNLQPAPKDVSKCWTSLADHHPSASYRHTVKLALFGSSQQSEAETYVSPMMRFSPSGHGYTLVEKPPEVVSVLVSPLKRKQSLPVHAEEPPLKLRLQEKWRKSLYQSQVIWRSKLKKQKGPYSSASVMRLKLSKAIGLKQSADPKKRKGRERGKEKSAQKLLSKVIKQRKEKLKRDVATLRKPADQDAKEAEAKSYAVRPVQDKNALVFSVLPKTFKLQGGPQEMEKPNNPAPSKPELLAERNPDRTVSKENGSMWNPSYSAKKYCPLQRTTSSLFLEFQKKYAEKTKQD